jgi:hypothetical protein
MGTPVQLAALRQQACSQGADAGVSAGLMRGPGRRAQAWGVLEARAGDLPRARELFQQGVWSQPGNRSVSRVWQARGRGPPAAPCVASQKLLSGG